MITWNHFCQMLKMQETFILHQEIVFQSIMQRLQKVLLSYIVLLFSSVSFRICGKQGPNSGQVSMRLLVIERATAKFSAVISLQMARYWPVVGMIRR